MKNIYLPQCLMSNAGKIFCLFLLMLGITTVKAADLSKSPVNSNLMIVVADLTTGLLDRTVVGFNPNSTDTFSPVYDANKLIGASNRQTLYTMNTGQWMSINILPSEANTDTVGMGFIPGNNHTFTFSFTGLSSFDTTSYIYLEDTKLDLWYNIRKGDYTFSSLTTDDWSRFILHFTPPVVITANDTTCTAINTVNIQQPGIAYWNYTLTDSSNTVVASGVLNQNNPASLQLAAGVYNLNLADTNGYVAVKTIQVNGTQAISAVNFTVSDTSVKALQVITLTDSITSTDSTNNGITYLWNFGNGTSGTGFDTSISYTEPGTYNLGLTVTNQFGCSATQTQKITVTSNPTTGLAEVSTAHDLNIWGNGNKIFVDFTNQATVDATITVYNVLGQELSSERHNASSVYKKEMDNVTASYVIVKVTNANHTKASKVFIANK